MVQDVFYQTYVVQLWLVEPHLGNMLELGGTMKHRNDVKWEHQPNPGKHLNPFHQCFHDRQVANPGQEAKTPTN